MPGPARFVVRPEILNEVRAMTFHSLTGLGHMPILEDPARTAACLLAFTATLTAREG